jgi:peptidoglycan/xylan/chitin deacetylase (PgdA/CDA1 family)
MTAVIGLIWVTAVTALGACRAKRVHKGFGPRFFSSERRVQCSKGFDRVHEWKHEALAASLERARDERLVLHSYGHAPKLDLAEYFPDFDWAAANGVPMVTFRELAAGYRGPGWAFTIDDDDVDIWSSWREQLRAHKVKVTFFVTRYDRLTAAQKQALRELAADGHDIESHGVAHENAVDYVAAHGLDSYVRDEVLPGKQALVADGYAPVAFAYPYGAHTVQIDQALAPEFALLRTVEGAWCLK